MSKIDQVHILCGESLLECLKSFHSFLGELTGFVQKDHGWLQGGTFQKERCAACAWHGRCLNVIFNDKCWKCASRAQGISRRPRRGCCVTRITFHFSCLPLAKLVSLERKIETYCIFFFGLEAKGGKQASLEDASR